MKFITLDCAHITQYKTNVEFNPSFGSEGRLNAFRMSYYCNANYLAIYFAQKKQKKQPTCTFNSILQL